MPNPGEGSGCARYAASAALSNVGSTRSKPKAMAIGKRASLVSGPPKVLPIRRTISKLERARGSTEASSSAGPHRSSGATARAKPGEVVQCGTCENTSKDVKWAAEEIIEIAGKSVSVPVGGGCDGCYHLGVELLGHASYAAFSAAYNSSEKVRETCNVIRKNMNEPNTVADWDPNTVTERTTVEAEMTHDFIGLTELHVKQMVNSHRLTKAGTKDVPEIQFPALPDVSTEKKYFLFPNDSVLPDDQTKNGVAVTLRVRKQIDMSQLKLTSTSNLWREHGQTLFCRQADAFMKEGFGDALNGKIRDVDDFLNSYPDTKRHKTASSSAPKMPALIGRAASEYNIGEAEAEEDEDQAIELHQDLSAQFATPTKSKSHKGETFASSPMGAATVVGSADDASTAIEEAPIDEEDMPASGDWVAYFKGKGISVRDMMCGKPKGRTLKAIRERVAKLVADPNTRSQGLLLENFHQKLKVGDKWRGGTCVGHLSAEELDKDLEVFEADGTVLVAEACQALVNREATRLSSEKLWQKLIQILLPFADSESGFTFNLRQPRLRDLPRHGAWKALAFQSSMHESLINPKLWEGESTKGELHNLCTALLAALEDIDAVVLDKSGAIMHADSMTIAAGLLTICDLPFSAQHADDVKKMVWSERKHLTSSSAITLVAAALDKSTYYKTRLQKYLAALPVILEHEEKMQTYTKAMDEFKAKHEKGELDRDFGKSLIAIHDGMSVVRKQVELTCVDDFWQKLMQCTAIYVEGMFAAMTADAQVYEDHGVTTFAVLSAASIAFPFDGRIATWQSTLADYKQNEFTTKCLANLHEGLEAFNKLDNEDKWKEKSWTALSKNAAACSNLQLEEKSLKLMKEILKDFLLSVSKAETTQGFEVFGEAENLASLFMAESSAFKSMIAFARKVEELRALHDVVKDDFSKAEHTLKFRQLLAHVQVALKDLGEKKLDEDIWKPVHSHAEKYIHMASALSKKMLATAMEEKEKKLREAGKALQNLIPIALAEKKWHHGLGANADVETMMAAAKKSGLVDLRFKEIDEKGGTLKSAVDELEAAQSLAGDLNKTDGMEDLKKLLEVAIILRTEHDLLLSLSGVADADQLRLEVQRAVKVLRAAKLKEKECLPAPLYKTAYKALIGR